MEPKIATAAFMGLREWQFRGAVFFGDTIRVKRTIGEKTEHKNPAQGFVIYEIEVLNQDDKVVQKGQWNMLIRRRRGLTRLTVASATPGSDKESGVRRRTVGPWTRSPTAHHHRRPGRARPSGSPSAPSGAT